MTDHLAENIAASFKECNQLREEVRLLKAENEALRHGLVVVLPTPLQGGGTKTNSNRVHGFNACIRALKKLNGETISKSRLESLRKNAERLEYVGEQAYSAWSFRRQANIVSVDLPSPSLPASGEKYERECARFIAAIDAAMIAEAADAGSTKG